MEKASKALRRSGVRIKSIGSGHSDLQMVISQLKDVRIASKAYAAAQSSAMQDLVKWSLKDENRAIQDALTQVGELFSIWSEVQREFTDHLKDFRHQFEMILEGARQLDLAKSTLQAAEGRETKIKKELKKAAKKATAEEIREMSVRLSEAEREKDIAQLEVVDRIREHEAIKLIRIKEGLFKVSEAYIDCAQKCDVIFGAQRDIALQIPDVADRDIQDIKYTGSGATMQAVARAKDKIKKFRRKTLSVSQLPPSPAQMAGLGRNSRDVGGRGGSLEEVDDDLPPPYSENPPVNPFYNEPSFDLTGGLQQHTSSLHYPHHRRTGHSFDHRRSDPVGDAALYSPSAGGRVPEQSLSVSVSTPGPFHLLSHSPLYPVRLDGGPGFGQDTATPPYQVHDPFGHVTQRRPDVGRDHLAARRSSCYSDAEDVTDAISSLNLSLTKR